MNELIQVDKNIPVPTERSKRSKYPWRELQVGDSFLIEPQMRSSMAGLAARFGMKITTANDGGKVRVWRIA